MADLKLLNNTTLHFAEGAAPSTPDAGEVVLYAKTDGKMYQKDDAGTETDLTSSGGGGGEFTEFAVVKRTAGDVTTTSGTFVDVTGLTVTLTTAAVRCLVTFTGFGNGGGANTISVDVAVDGTRQGGTYGLTSHTGSGQGNLSFSFWTDVLSAASHTIKLQFKNDGGATSTIYASAIAPAIFTVAESSLAT